MTYRITRWSTRSRCSAWASCSARVSRKASAITPGRFNPWGTYIAVYFLVTGVTGLAILGVQSWVQSVFYGAALVIAVSASAFVKKRRERAARLS